jgi:bifunctional UDP-N-acetylglucosamine pyrophosphorylase/glucosamine-1-phosphate N-acetyltransferase
MPPQHKSQDKNLDKQLEVVVLAAGQGTRMRSTLPKVPHPLAGKPLLVHVLEAVEALAPTQTHVVVGHGADAVADAVKGTVPGLGTLNWVTQTEQRGTAHAVDQALPHVHDDATVLVVFGDVPLVTAETLTRCADAASRGALALVTARFEDPAELGRIVREGGTIRAIVEYADATATEREINEINSGILALSANALKKLLREIESENAQGEYYLTDLVGLAVRHNIPVEGLLCTEPGEVAGVNDRVQLAALERIYQHRAAEKLMRAGVTIADPTRVDIRGEVEVGEDCFLDINVVLEGQVRLGRGVRIGPGSVIKDSALGDDVVVAAHTVVEGAEVAARCSLGPFARVRPGTELAEDVKIGNFVETKKARLGRGTKASHLTYLGDATLGENCNVGAGTVTCNYDGVDKHHTTIGDNVFVGTNSTLVAPVELGNDAFVAAGSTVTTRVKDGDLAVGRGRQRNISGWTRPDRKNSDGLSDEDGDDS